MIGTFWNLCRACPSMPVDKLHSEYRSTYRWHEYTGPRQEVVRKPPQPISGNKEEEEIKNVENMIAPPTPGGNIEPALPRRKKNPSLAYRTHDLLTSKRDKENHTSTSLDRARCAERERDRSSRRSKSEGPPNPPSPPPQHRVLRSDSDPSQFAQDLISNFPLESSDGGGLKSAISRISTEYRLQFAWPRGKRGKEEESSGPPRKSLSMGAIRPAAGSNPNQPPAPVHKKRILQADKLGGTAELEPLVSNQESEYAGEEKIIQESFSKGEKLQSENLEFKTEYKKKFRPFSQYDYIEGRFKPKREPEPQILHELENEHQDSWFSEVIELRKKAGEYKHRGWGTELVPEHIAELYNKQITLWEQVSRRSSLSALSLASSTHRSITKEEKEKENNKKSSPTKAFWPENVIKHSQKIEKSDEVRKDYPPRSRIDHFVRHHLERTTGAGEEGILHSPTREKLEPVVIRRKDTGNEPTRSPQKVQPLTGRSQSAGPNTSSLESRSPKRTPRASHGTKQSAPDKKQRPKDKPGDEVETSEAEIPEPLVKSPPEPTRVKSPEQVLMRSPEPVNWTVPLDTGKTFTVTQNVSEALPPAKLYKGEALCRPQSESKMRSETMEPPPPPPQSAPPTFTDQSDWKIDDSEVKTTYEKAAPGTTLRCLDDPSFTFESSSHDPKSSSDVIEKAHSRFDQFWGKTNQENEESQG